MDFPRAIQAIAALEFRAAMFEAAVANGTPLETVEYAIRDSLEAAEQLRAEHHIERDAAAERSVLEQMFWRSVREPVTNPGYWTSAESYDEWSARKAHYDALQTADPEAPR